MQRSKFMNTFVCDNKFWVPQSVLLCYLLNNGASMTPHPTGHIPTYAPVDEILPLPCLTKKSTNQIYKQRCVNDAAPYEVAIMLILFIIYSNSAPSGIGVVLIQSVLNIRPISLILSSKSVLVYAPYIVSSIVSII